MINEPQLQSLIEALLGAPASCGHSTLVTVDGPSGSGKTSLAYSLQHAIHEAGQDCVVIHLDDHYNGWSDALGPSLTALLSEQVLPGIERGSGFSLPRFDWNISRFQDEIKYPPARFFILEGVGAGQRCTESNRSISIWIEVPDEVGLARVLQRDGTQVLKPMVQFQEDQRRHFATESTKLRATYRFDGS